MIVQLVKDELFPFYAITNYVDGIEGEIPDYMLLRFEEIQKDFQWMQDKLEEYYKEWKKKKD